MLPTSRQEVISLKLINFTNPCDGLLAFEWCVKFNPILLLPPTVNTELTVSPQVSDLYSIVECVYCCFCCIVYRPYQFDLLFHEYYQPKFCAFDLKM